MQTVLAKLPADPLVKCLDSKDNRVVVAAAMAVATCAAERSSRDQVDCFSLFYRTEGKKETRKARFNGTRRDDDNGALKTPFLLFGSFTIIVFCFLFVTNSCAPRGRLMRCRSYYKALFRRFGRQRAALCASVAATPRPWRRCMVSISCRRCSAWPTVC